MQAALVLSFCGRSRVIQNKRTIEFSSRSNVNAANSPECNEAFTACGKHPDRPRRILRERDKLLSLLTSELGLNSGRTKNERLG